MVLLVCVVCLVCYAVAAAVLRKLDQLDLRRASVVPLCGKDGLYKYEIQVKTGWTRGAGEGAGLRGQVVLVLTGAGGFSLIFMASVSVELMGSRCVFTP